MNNVRISRPGEIFGSGAGGRFLFKLVSPTSGGGSVGRCVKSHRGCTVGGRRAFLGNFLRIVAYNVCAPSGAAFCMPVGR